MLEPRFVCAAIFFGLGFGYVMFATPVYLTFQQALADCARQQSRDGCLASSRAGCLWINSTCYFPDYQTVNCSLYNNNSDSCSTFSAAAAAAVGGGASSLSSTSHHHPCWYLFTQNQCLHYAGFDEVEVGGFAAATISGGCFGPYLMAKFAARTSNVTSVFVTAALSLLSAVLFSIGIEREIFALWVISKILSSVVSFVGASMLPDVMREYEVAPPDRVKLTRLMGAMIGVGAFFVALFLYVDMPRGITFRDADPEFKLRLQMFNVVQYVIGVGFTVFALSLKTPALFSSCHCSCWPSWSSGNENTLDCELLEHTDEKSERQQHQEEQPVMEEQQELVADPPPLVTEKTDESDSTKKQQPQHDAPRQAVTTADRAHHRSDDEHSDVACCGYFSEANLAWLCGILAPLHQQTSGIAAVAPYVPMLMQQVIADPLLAQLCFAIALPAGAISSFVIFTRFYTPLQVFVVTAFVCCFASFIIGLALMPGVSSNNEGAAAALSFVGVILFAFGFGAGPSSMFFAALVEMFSAVRGGFPVGRGVAFGVSFTATVQTVLRLLFPIFVARVSSDIRIGRSMAFFGFSILGTVFGLCLVVTRWMMKRTFSSG